MAIKTSCSNGHKLVVKDRLAGRKVKCPKCGVKMEIPSPTKDANEADDLEVLDDEPAGASSSSVAIQSDLLTPIPQTPAANGLPQQPLVTPGQPVMPQQPSAMQPAPLQPAQMQAMPAQQAPMQPRPPQPTPAAEANTGSSGGNLKWLIIGGGAGFALILLVGVVFMLTRGNKEPADEQQTTAKSSARPNQTTSQPEKGTNAKKATKPVPKSNYKPAPPRQMKAVKAIAVRAPTPLSRPGSVTPKAKKLPTPLHLAEIARDARLGGFRLPDKTWGAAYDANQGRLAITNDKEGVLFYDVEKLLNDDTGPVGKLAVEGRPHAICFKNLSNGRTAFIVSSRDSPNLQVIDSKSLKSLQEITIPNATSVQSLQSSNNPKDPFVYFITAREKPQPKAQPSSERIGRVDLNTGQFSKLSKWSFSRLRVSDSGDAIYAIRGSGRVVAGSFEKILAYPDAMFAHLRSAKSARLNRAIGGGGLRRLRFFCKANSVGGNGIVASST